MEGKQFSTSRGYTILVRDVLERYGPDGIRYFICAAGPENQDANFTWRDFVQRNNSELVAGWGNLVIAHGRDGRQELRRDPAAGRRSSRSTRRCAPPCSPGFDAVGDLLERHRQKAAIAEAMRVVGEVNAYVSRTEPFKLKGDDQRERLATVLHTLVQCVSDLNTMLAPFLPHAANRVDAVLGGDGAFVPMPRLETVAGLDDGDEGRTYPVITGDYTATPRWESRPVVVGHPDQQAGAGLHQARRVGGRRGARPGGGGPEPGDVAAEPARCIPEPPDPLPIPVVDNHTHLDISRDGDEVSVDDLGPVLAAARGGRCRPGRAGRLRPARRPLRRRGRRPACRRARRRRAAPQRGAGAGGERRARRGLRRDRAARRAAPGAGRGRDRARLLPHRARRAFRHSRTRSAGTSTSPSASTAPCRSTTATATTTCCACSPRRARPSAR